MGFVRNTPPDITRRSGAVYKNPQVVYRQKAGGAVELHHGTVIEGSVDHGGIQPNYVVDLHHPKLKTMLEKARALRDNDSLKFQDKISLVT